MKYLLIILLDFCFVLYFCVDAVSQFGDYIWLRPKPTAERLMGINIAAGKIYIVANAGVLLTSTNNGVNWDFKKISDTSFADVFVVGNDVHIVGGSYDNKSIRLYFKSTDGGLTFQNLTQNTIVGQGDTLKLNTLSFTDVNTGYVAGNNGFIYKTTNGGLNWFSQNSGVTATINEMYFPPSGTGLTGYMTGGSAGTAFVIKTVDGGNNWTLLSIPAVPSSNNLGAIHFSDVNTGYVTGGGNFALGTIALKTTNGGTNWTFIDINAINPNIRYDVGGGVYVVNQDTVYAVGVNANIVRTTNGGVSWEKLFPESTFNFGSAFLTGISFIGNTGFICGAGGTVIKIEDTTKTFIAGEILYQAYDVRFSVTDSLIGWVAGGGQRSNPGGTVIKYALLENTTDGGNTWGPQTLPQSDFIFRGVEMADNNNIWAVGEGGRVFRTTDAGDNWTIVSIGATEELREVKFKNQLTGFIGGSGKIYRTTNGGNNWTAVTFSGGSQVNEMEILPNGNIVAAVDGAYTQRSTDDGLTWISASLPNTNYDENIFFYDDNIGWTCGLIGNIAKTTNGGVSWAAVTSGIFSSSLDGGIYFWDLNNGAAFGLTGLVLRTTDGGTTWYKTYPFTSQPFRNAFFVNGSRAYFSTDLGGVIKYSQTLTNITKEPGIAADFKLYQNYPNPFNNSTVISFDLTSGDYVSVSVYDIMGREVAVLHDGYLNAGSHKINFNSSALSSGVYFYKVKTGSSRLFGIKSMVLLK
ncbi:MAG: T9SS type A sorting domain-containing protein [Ignavibacteria bacterium]|nr:T9SS type A sorting domain-containing protein [Ignavibacteria bacterium]